MPDRSAEPESGTAAIAHELANLLTVVIGRAHLVLRTLPPDHPARADAEEIEAAAQRAAALSGRLIARPVEDAGGAQGSKR